MSSTVRAPQTLLFKAIDHADRGLLGSILKEMIEAAPEVAEIVESHLLVSKSELESKLEEEDDGTSDGDENESVHPRKKQKREVEQGPDFIERYRLCRNCKEKFDVSENDDEDCWFHPGKLYEVADYWVDEWPGEEFEHDPDEHPEGFRWSCCSKFADSEECKGGKHEIEDDSVERVRRS